MSPDGAASASILVVDDNPADARLIREALTGRSIHVAEDAQEALAFLASHYPSLVFLDLHLPGMSGHELLSAIRTHERLAAIPVVVFSSSDSTDDVTRAYSASANCYVTKPAGLDQFLDTVQRIDRFWMPAR